MSDDLITESIGGITITRRRLPYRIPDPTGFWGMVIEAEKLDAEIAALAMPMMQRMVDEQWGVEPE